MRRWLSSAAVATGLFLAGTPGVLASCRITNQTGYDFVIASGNVGDQRVKAHGITTIAPGKVLGKTDEGRTISGVCKDGGDLVIKEQDGVPRLMPKTQTPPPKPKRSK
jgi:hypothetical protein